MGKGKWGTIGFHQPLTAYLGHVLRNGKYELLQLIIMYPGLTTLRLDRLKDKKILTKAEDKHEFNTENL